MQEALATIRTTSNVLQLAMPALSPFAWGVFAASSSTARRIIECLRNQTDSLVVDFVAWSYGCSGLLSFTNLSVIVVDVASETLNDAKVDCGAITMGARQIAHYQALVDDAVSKGARVLNGGFVPSRGDPLASGSFYPPTVLCDVPESALIAQKEIFGPIMCIFKVRDMGSPAANDDEIVRMANNCEFALSSCARACGGSLERPCACCL